MSVDWQGGGLCVHALRLEPGMDLRADIHRFGLACNLQSGFVLTCVGSLARARLRLAARAESTTLEGRFEIVSLVGTLSPDGPHLHVAIADDQGHVVGGHLLDGSVVYTTAEIVLAEAEGLRFSRTVDEKTGFRELTITSRFS
jgi:predicted DNA-binding protein with PD1-like motif